MNKRIRELVEKSYIYDRQNDSSFFNKEKFAELIVRQCMALCEDVTERNDPAIACYYEIKQHFYGEEL